MKLTDTPRVVPNFRRKAVGSASSCLSGSRALLAAVSNTDSRSPDQRGWMNESGPYAAAESAIREIERLLRRIQGSTEPVDFSPRLKYGDSSPHVGRKAPAPHRVAMALDPVRHFVERNAPFEVRRYWDKFTAPTYALPVDLFRVAISVVSCGYFLRAFRESSDISSPHGLIDHRLVREMLWYTKLGLFHPAMSPKLFRLIYLLAAGGSLGLAVGVQVRPVSAALYLTAVSSYRWNFPVSYLDDSAMHLMLLWAFLLPTGQTLRIDEWLRDRGAAIERWKRAQVPGASVRAFMANMALVYLVAGAWKYSSPMWRQGIAVYAGMKTCASWNAERWNRSHLPLFKLGNHLTLAMEPLFPLASVLPTHHWLKRFLGAGMLAFHGTILATLRIPIANAAFPAHGLITFRNEIMGFLNRGKSLDPVDGLVELPRFGAREKAATGLVSLLALAMLSDALLPRWRSGTHDLVRQNRKMADRTPGLRQNPFHGVLWALGLAQSYRLFDWIDERNYYVTYEMTERGAVPRTLDPRALFPAGARYRILETYLNDVMWMKIPRNRLPDFQRSIFDRLTLRYCANCGESEEIMVNRNVQRITKDNLDLDRAVTSPFLTFRCQDGKSELLSASLVGL